MNNIDYIKKYFSFLTKYGFKATYFKRNGDAQGYFQRGTSIIDIEIYLGMSMNYVADVKITINGTKNNLLNSHVIFGDDQIFALKHDLNEKDALSQIDIYAKFIHENLSLLTV